MRHTQPTKLCKIGALMLVCRRAEIVTIGFAERIDDVGELIGGDLDGRHPTAVVGGDDRLSGRAKRARKTRARQHQRAQYRESDLRAFAR